MVYIHGGGFVCGAGDIKTYSPDYLLDHDVVLVVGNYRLGVLGFFSLANAELPGNMGLKDQHLLLQWVQDNIATFGGNPRRVTLFGNSAGSASVGYHLLSKNSYQLFQRAIMQSGTPHSPWAMVNLRTSVANAVKLGNILGCALSESQDDLYEFLACMRDKDAKELTRKGNEVAQTDWGFLPNVESSLEGFIQKNPSEYKRSIGLDIPVLIGVTADEGAFYTASELYTSYLCG